MRIQIEELNGRSAFTYCRSLDPEVYSAGELLEVYRGDTLAYTVNDINWGRRQVTVENNKEGPLFRKYKPFKMKK